MWRRNMYVSLDLGFSNEFEEDKITIEQRKEVGKILSMLESKLS